MATRKLPQVYRSTRELIIRSTSVVNREIRRSITFSYGLKLNSKCVTHTKPSYTAILFHQRRRFSQIHNQLWTSRNNNEDIGYKNESESEAREDGVLPVNSNHFLENRSTDEMNYESERKKVSLGKKDETSQRTQSEDVKFSDLAELDEELLQNIEPYTTPALPMSPTLAAYVDQSETLSKLVKLGVNLSEVDKRGSFKDYLVKLDFERDIQGNILFLHDIGIKDESLGKLLTKNPFLLAVDLDKLTVRRGYLKEKKFTDDAITQIVNRAPYFLNFSIKRVDRKLGFLQQELRLTGDETRYLVTRAPKLVTGKIETIKRNLFSLRFQLRFTAKELKDLVLNQPKILTTGRYKLLSTFDYLHNTVGIKHKQMTQFPHVFRSSLQKFKERHKYLVKLGRAQYDVSKPGYVSLERMIIVPDEIFCEEIAKSSIVDFNNFLKTL